MRSFAIFAAIFAAVAVAAPAPAVENSIAIVKRNPTVDDVQAQAQALISAKEAAGCHTLKCATALAPTLVSCAAAVAELGVNVIADAACFASATNSAVNKPSACDNCF